jgi:hypothetical protein
VQLREVIEALDTEKGGDAAVWLTGTPCAIIASLRDIAVWCWRASS